MFFIVVKLLTILGVLGIACAQTDNRAELKRKYTPILLPCLKDHKVTPEEILQLTNKNMPDSRNAKCLFACAYKKIGMMDEQGMVSEEGINKLSLEVFKDDGERKTKVSAFIEECKKINKVKVSDGTNGCERAGLLFKCSVEQGPEFGFLK